MLWNCGLQLDQSRNIVSGSNAILSDAIQHGADMRVATAFRHNEHIDIASSDSQLIEEAMDFGLTYLLDKHWVAAVETLRMPVSIPDHFGPRPSMSFFLYNQDGRQACAHLFLDGQPATGTIGPTPAHQRGEHDAMLKYHELDTQDADTNAPSRNFIYDFESMRYMICDCWEQVFGHDKNGEVMSGRLENLVEAIRAGHEVKVAIRGLCADLAETPPAALDHEVFVHIGPSYYYTESRLLISETHPLVRIQPAIPLVYRSRGWDVGWLMPRTDGFVARWLCDPYSLKYEKSEGRYAMRWFVRR